MRVAIIGAGMAGLACAEMLKEAGLSPVLFDKGRGPGGRMSTRRIATEAGEAAFDHGAQYFTVRDAAFRARVDRWAADGCAAPWPAAAADAWVGTPGMNAPIRRMAEGLDVRWGARIDGLVRQGAHWRLTRDGLDEGAFEAVVVAVPAEQAGPLLAAFDPDMARLAKATVSEPCWTVMAAFDAPVAVMTDILRGDGALGWAARNSAKPGRTGPESWVIQADPAWSRAHLEDPAPEVLAALLAGLSGAATAPLPPTLATSAHRWRYARCGKPSAGPVWNPALRLGVCGDWLRGPRVECAWLSGVAVAEAMLGEGAPIKA